MIAGITEVGNIDEAKSCGIEKNFLYLEKDCTSNDDKMKYPFLVCLFKLILSLPWEQCSWKRFLNKQTAVGNAHETAHGSLLKKETIEAIRIVKDSIFKYESILDISIIK